MSRLTRDGTAEPVSRDQNLRRVQEQGNNYFPSSADHEQDWLLHMMTIQVCTYILWSLSLKDTSSKKKMRAIVITMILAFMRCVEALRT